MRGGLRNMGLGCLGVVILAFALYIAFGYLFTYSKGDRIGTVIKLSHKGWIFKTWEGQLNLGAGLTTNEKGEITPSIWDFTVPRNNDQVLEGIESAMENGYRVKLYYREKPYRLFWRGDTRYMVYKIEKVAG